MRCVPSAGAPVSPRRLSSPSQSGLPPLQGVFSIVNAALLNPFPFADINRIVRLDMIDKGKPRGLSVTARQLVALQHSEVFDGAFASNTWEMTLTGQGLPEAVRTQYFSANGLNVLGVPPLLGRVFNEADGPAGEQPQRVVVLTYRFWQRHFGGRPEAVGQTLNLNREPYTVIGVLPRQYFYTGPEILVPLDLTFDTNFAWGVQARLKRGVTPRMAEQRLQPLFDQFAKEAPQRFPKEVRPLVRSSGGDTKGGRLCADPPVDLRGVYVAAPARMRERVDPAVGARDVAGA